MTIEDGGDRTGLDVFLGSLSPSISGIRPIPWAKRLDPMVNASMPALHCCCQTSRRLRLKASVKGLIKYWTMVCSPLTIKTSAGIPGTN